MPEAQGLPNTDTSDPIGAGVITHNDTGRGGQGYVTPIMGSSGENAVITGNPDSDLYTDPDPTDFAGDHQHFLDRHKDEVKPVTQNPFAVAIVSRAYRELSNGNLAEQLLSLASQNIPSSEFRAYIAVNNVRALAIAAQVWDREKVMLGTLSPEERQNVLRDLTLQEFKIRKIDLQTGDSDALSSTSSTLEQKVQDYKENQATLRVLQTLTEAVNALTTSPSELGTDITNKALENIRSAAQHFLTDAQLQVLMRASHAIMRRKIFVVGVDCSSLSNAYINRNQGQATDEAVHLAIEQGAKYIDIGDMDEYREPNVLKEIIQAAHEGRIDVLIRPLRLFVPQHPEQFDSSRTWGDLVKFYANTVTITQERYSDPESNFSGSSGTIVVSARAYKKHPQPHKGFNEDYEYAARMRGDRDLVVRHALDSDLRLAQRKRAVSFEGAVIDSHVNSESLEEIRAGLIATQRAKIQQFVVADNQLIQQLTQVERDENDPDYLQIYMDKRREFFERNQRERAQNRRMVLGIRKDGSIAHNGILPRAYALWKKHPEWTVNDMLKTVPFSNHQRAFLDQNPLLFSSLVSEMKRITQVGDVEQSSFGALPPSLELIVEHLEYSLPELFAPPLVQEPTYDKETISQLPSSEVNQLNWMQIVQAKDWLERYVDNLQADGKIFRLPFKF